MIDINDLEIIKKYLKENLTIQVSTEYDFQQSGSGFETKAQLLLGGEQISESSSFYSLEDYR